MAFEFDHVFICVSVGGEEASALAAFGLTEGTPNVHPGQGTACRRFFFANSYLELLWVSNAGEARNRRRFSRRTFGNDGRAVPVASVLLASAFVRRFSTMATPPSAVGSIAPRICRHRCVSIWPRTPACSRSRCCFIFLSVCEPTVIHVRNDHCGHTVPVAR